MGKRPTNQDMEDAADAKVAQFLKEHKVWQMLNLVCNNASVDSQSFEWSEQTLLMVLEWRHLYLLKAH